MNTKEQVYNTKEQVENTKEQSDNEREQTDTAEGLPNGRLSKFKEWFAAQTRRKKISTIFDIVFSVTGAILSLVFMFVDDPGYNNFPLWWISLPAFLLHVALLAYTLKKIGGDD